MSKIYRVSPGDGTADASAVRFYGNSAAAIKYAIKLVAMNGNQGGANATVDSTGGRDPDFPRCLNVYRDAGADIVRADYYDPFDDVIRDFDLTSV